MTPLERFDLIIGKLENGSSFTKELVGHVERLRKQLDTIKTKATKAKREPNAYNKFIAEKMIELKDAELDSKDKFKECIRLWNVQKGSTAKDAEVDAQDNDE